MFRHSQRTAVHQMGGRQEALLRLRVARFTNWYRIGPNGNICPLLLPQASFYPPGNIAPRPTPEPQRELFTGRSAGLPSRTFEAATALRAQGPDSEPITTRTGALRARAPASLLKIPPFSQRRRACFYHGGDGTVPRCFQLGGAKKERLKRCRISHESPGSEGGRKTRPSARRGSGKKGRSAAAFARFTTRRSRASAIASGQRTRPDAPLRTEALRNTGGGGGGLETQDTGGFEAPSGQGCRELGGGGGVNKCAVANCIQCLSNLWLFTCRSLQTTKASLSSQQASQSFQQNPQLKRSYSHSATPGKRQHPESTEARRNKPEYINRGYRE